MEFSGATSPLKHFKWIQNKSQSLNSDWNLATSGVKLFYHSVLAAVYNSLRGKVNTEIVRKTDKVITKLELDLSSLGPLMTRSVQSLHFMSHSKMDEYHSESLQRLGWQHIKTGSSERSNMKRDYHTFTWKALHLCYTLRCLIHLIDISCWK